MQGRPQMGIWVIKSSASGVKPSGADHAAVTCSWHFRTGTQRWATWRRRRRRSLGTRVRARIEIRALTPKLILTAGLGRGAGGPGSGGGGGAGGHGRARGAGARPEAARCRAAARSCGLQAHVLLARVGFRGQVQQPLAVQPCERATCRRRLHAGSRNELLQVQKLHSSPALNI